jgi:intermediate peptidase
VCVPALQQLVQRVFGLTLRPAPPADAAELWHRSVQKLHLTDPATDAVLGTLYLDLHARPHKMPGAANFVLANGAQLEDGTWRAARVALVTSFGEGLLSHGDLETLLHEAGHSLACLLSRTSFQTVSGVRCAADWVETPSTLLEHYAWDYNFVALFARHHSTGARLPPDLWRRLCAQRHAFAALELQEQVFLSALDLALHSASPRSATETAHALERQYTSFQPVSGTAQQTRFAHLSNYASTYYSYLFSRLSAAAIWQRHVVGQSLTRSVGRVLQDELFAHGGARDPKVILHRLLGNHVPDVKSLLDEIKQ